MSLQFSNTTTKNGILQRIERTVGFNDGDITGNALRLAQFTGDVNTALDKAFDVIFKAGGRSFDDSNYSTGIPTVGINLVSGTRSYALTVDSGSNLVVDIYKVYVATTAAATEFKELIRVDAQSEAPASYNNGLSATGIPSTWDLTGKYISLDLIPNYSATNGIKVLVSREGSYFTTSDTTKTPGFAGLFHEYLVLRPSYEYARANSLANLKQLEADVFRMEAALEKHYSLVERGVRMGMKPNVENTR